jgi:hypothetical protein
MESEEPKAKELVVKAQYFIPIEPTEDNLRSIQRKLTEILMQEGFQTKDTPLPYTAVDRTMEFIRVPPPGEKTRLEKLKELFTSNTGNRQRNQVSRTEFLDGLKRLRDDLPFRLVFRFKTFQGEDTEGYDLFIESTPVLLQKSRQLKLHPDYQYSVENIVDQNKREIKQILGRLELEPTRGPYTEAEALDSRLTESTIQRLDEHRYGRAAIQYINEGDQCLQQNLLNAALSCYIQGIEWIILYYKTVEDDEDLVEKQQQGEIGPVYFKDLVEEISEDTSASQKTVSKLNNFNSAERRWVAHHKSGQLESQDVENVRSTLLRLTTEIL